VLPVTQLSVSNHWRKYKTLTLTNDLDSTFLHPQLDSWCKQHWSLKTSNCVKSDTLPLVWWWPRCQKWQTHYHWSGGDRGGRNARSYGKTADGRFVTHGTDLQQSVELGATYWTVVSLVSKIVSAAATQTEVSARQYEGVAWLTHADDTLWAVVVDVVIVTLQVSKNIIMHHTKSKTPAFLIVSSAAAVLGIFIWVGQSKAKQILDRPTGVVYVGIMGMTRAVWVGQERVWVGHGLLSLISRTASGYQWLGERWSMCLKCQVSRNLQVSFLWKKMHLAMTEKRHKNQDRYLDYRKIAPNHLGARKPINAAKTWQSRTW